MCRSKRREKTEFKFKKFIFRISTNTTNKMSLLAVNALKVASRRTFSVASVMKSGGDEGSIRAAGGIWGEKEAAAENIYFRKVVSVRNDNNVHF